MKLFFYFYVYKLFIFIGPDHILHVRAAEVLLLILLYAAHIPGQDLVHVQIFNLILQVLKYH